MAMPAQAVRDGILRRIEGLFVFTIGASGSLGSQQVEIT
jgi:hypothetical protein